MEICHLMTYLLKHSPRMGKAVSKSKLSHLVPTSLISLLAPYTPRLSLPPNCQEAVLLNSRPIQGQWCITKTATEKCGLPGA